MATYNSTKKLAKNKVYEINGETHTYHSLCTKVKKMLKVAPRSPSYILKELGIEANSHVHLLPTMMSDGVIEMHRIPKSDKLVYTANKKNRLQELLIPRDKLFKRFKILSRITHHSK